MCVIIDGKGGYTHLVTTRSLQQHLDIVGKRGEAKRAINAVTLNIFLCIHVCSSAIVMCALQLLLFVSVSAGDRRPVLLVFVVCVCGTDDEQTETRKHASAPIHSPHFT